MNEKEKVMIMYALLGVLPLVLAIVMMLVFKQKASFSMLGAWALSFILAIIFWGMELPVALTYTFFGFLSAIDVIFIISSAIFLLNVLLELRFIETIGKGFNGITQDRRIQILIISWFFGAFIEGAAGFGTPAALAAPLLVGLGVPPFFAALASLIANSTPVIFGAAGTPTTAGFATISGGLMETYGQEVVNQAFFQFNNRASFVNMFVGLFLPFLMISWIVMRDGRKRGIKDALSILPLCLYAGLIYVIPAWLISFLGPELPTIVGSLVGLGLMILAVKRGFLVPKTVYRFMDDPIKEEVQEGKNTGVPLWFAWSPYAVIAILLVITRLPGLPFFDLIRHDNVTVSWSMIFGFEGINWIWRPLNNPGVFPFLPVAFMFLIVRKANREVVGRVTKKSLMQLRHAIVALCFGVALVQIMRFTDYPNFGTGELTAMTTEIASALATMFGPLYLLVAPLIGGLGGFVSGSNTVSNIMFTGLQIETAARLGLPLLITLVAQTSGGAVGSMISINNIVAVSATTNSEGKESKLLAAVIIPFLLYCLAISIILFIMLGLGVSWVL